MMKLNILIIIVAVLMMGCLEKSVAIQKVDLASQKKKADVIVFFEKINTTEPGINTGATIGAITVNFSTEGAIGTTYSAMRLNLLKNEEYDIVSMTTEGENIIARVRRIEKKTILSDMSVFDTTEYNDTTSTVYKEIVTDASINVAKVDLNIEYQLWINDKGSYSASGVERAGITHTVDSILPGKVGLERVNWNYLSLSRASKEIKRFTMPGIIKKVKIVKDKSAYFVKGDNYIDRTYKIKFFPDGQGDYLIDMNSFLTYTE